MLPAMPFLGVTAVCLVVTMAVAMMPPAAEQPCAGDVHAEPDNGDRDSLAKMNRDGMHEPDDRFIGDEQRYHRQDDRTGKSGQVAELAGAESEAPIFGVFSLLYPALLKVHVAHSRTMRQIAQLRAVEAVRMHVASTGQIPQSLADVTIVPVPDDPTTGKPFAYETKDGTFTLGTTAASATGSVPKIYVVTIRK